MLFEDYAVGSIAEAGNGEALLTIEGFNSDEETLYILAGQGSVDANFQIMYSMGDSIYINSFNQRLVPMDLPGVCVINGCGEGGDGLNGEPAFMKFFRTNNIITSQRPLKLSYAGLVLTGYLHKLQLGSFNKEEMRGFQFTLAFLGYMDNLQLTAESSGSSANNASSTVLAQLGAQVDTGGDESQPVRSGKLR